MKTLLFVFIVCFAFSGTSQAQSSSSGSTSMYIVPAEPTESDEVLLVIHAFLPHSSCYLITESLEIDISENNIVVEAHYFSGFLTMPCSTVDTIVLGQLSAGHYDLTANFDLSDFWETDSLSFFVEMSTNITSSESMGMNLNVFPNPTDGETVQIVFTAEEAGIGDFSIHDLSGRMVYSKTEAIVQGENYISLSYPDISSGMYVVSVGLADMRYSKKLIVK